MAEYGALFPPEFHQFNDKYAQHVHDARHTVSATVAASTPTITTLSGSDFLHKLSATILGSLQFQASRHAAELTNTFSTVATGLGQPTTTTTTIPRSISANNMDYEMTPNRVLVDSSSFSSMDEMQKQLEYDKFMNEIWIGIVLTLIVISLVFCICSCFLYHQFRTWKRNYNATVAEAQAIDVEAVKLNPDREDPVPEYTLVSGLPSYEAALELLHKTPSTCVIVYPSVFSVFNRHEEKLSNSTNNNNNNNVDTIDIQQQQQQQQQQQLQQQQQQLQQHQQQLQQFTITNESSSTPLMAETMSIKSSHDVPSYAEATTTTTTTVAPLPATTTTTRMISLTCVNEKSSGKKSSNDSTTTTTTRIYEKVPSYEEALMVKSFDTKTSS